MAFPAPAAHARGPDRRDPAARGLRRQIQANPGIVQTYRILLGGGNNSIWQDYVTYLGRIVHLNFGISTSNYPAPVSEVIGKTLPYSIFLVGVAFLLAFARGNRNRDGRGLATRQDGRQHRRPGVHGARRVPAFFTALLFMYVFGLKLHWFPIQHAYDSDVVPGFSWTFISSAFRYSHCRSS